MATSKVKVPELKRVNLYRSGGRVTAKFGYYSAVALIFGAGKIVGSFMYVYANGYLVPIKTVSSVTASIASDYVTVTITNNSTENMLIGILCTTDCAISATT